MRNCCFAGIFFTGSLRFILLPVLIALPATSLHAQDKAAPSNVLTTADAGPAAQVAASWSRLENGVTGTKNTETRIAAITALSVLGGEPKAEKLVRDTLHDADIDVRLAAIVAAGEMGRPMGQRSNFAMELRNLLNDADPKVAFTSASTLWKMNDPSGEDILIAVAGGERSADYNFWKGSEHTANRTLHSPSALAKIAVQQGMVILVPPVGIGMGAYGYLKGAGGPDPQVTAITQIAKERTSPVKNVLMQATGAKNIGARLAATEALAQFRGDDVRAALEPLLNDSHENIRFMANAAYIRSDSAPATAAPKRAKR